MIRRLTLSQRLTLVFTAILLFAPLRHVASESTAVISTAT